MAVEYDANGTPILTNDSLISDVPPYTQALAAASIMPVGAIMPYMGTAAPNYWLLCDGRSYDAAYFDGLARVNGNFHGDTSTDATLRVPDLRNRVPVGYDMDNITASSPMMFYRPNLGQRHGDQRLHQHIHLAWGPTSVPGNSGGTVTTSYADGTNSYTQTGKVGYNTDPSGTGFSENIQPGTAVNFIVYSGKPTLDTNGDILAECGQGAVYAGATRATEVIESRLEDPNLTEMERAVLTAQLNDEPRPVFTTEEIEAEAIIAAARTKENHAK